MKSQEFHGFNPSQDIINLQTKYSLFGRVANIVFSTTVEGGFDKDLMTEAINLTIQRNDSLRITFVKDKGKTLQYFVPSRTIGSIPEYRFRTNAEQNAFLHRFRKGKLDCFKGETLKVAYATDLEGRSIIYFKISHFVADTYGISVIISDLFSVYDVLKKGGSLQFPDEPGSFEEVLRKDESYRGNEDAMNRDKEFFRDYYSEKPRPTYCGIHGSGSDLWMKQKRKGSIAMPYAFVKCDTEGYKLSIPSSVTAKAQKWSEEHNISLSTFFFYTYCLADSIINSKAENLVPLMLLECRGTLAERKAAGTKVQSISVYSHVDYSKSFDENIAAQNADMNRIFRHTGLSYLDVEALQHELWNYSLMKQMTAFCYSFIPFSAPKGVDLQIHSNGKGALVTYVALLYDIESGRIDVTYDIQKIMITPAQLMDFHNLYVDVIERVLENPDKILSELF